MTNKIRVHPCSSVVKKSVVKKSVVKKSVVKKQ